MVPKDHEANQETEFSKCKISRALLAGIINLIPKGNKDCRLLENLYPITLLNINKIVEKAIANRLKQMLAFVINNDQKAFI